MALSGKARPPSPVFPGRLARRPAIKVNPATPMLHNVCAGLDRRGAGVTAPHRIYIRLVVKGGQGHGRAGSHGGVPGDRGHRGRDPGDDRLGPAGLHRRRPAGQGGRRIARAGARGAELARAGVAAEAHHRQSRPRRRAEGGQPFRPADRARRCWRRWRRCRPTSSPPTRRSASCRSTARSPASPACCSPALCRRRPRERHHLPGRVRRRGGLGRRDRDPRGAEPAGDRQPFQGHPAVAAARAAARRRGAPPGSISRTSRARKPPSARSRSPPPAATTC